MFIDQPVRGPFKIQYAYFTDLYPARVTHPCLRECTNIECDAVILQFKCLCFSGALIYAHDGLQWSPRNPGTKWTAETKVVRETVSEYQLSIDTPWKDGSARFTLEPLNPLTD